MPTNPSDITDDDLAAIDMGGDTGLPHIDMGVARSAPINVPSFASGISGGGGVQRQGLGIGERIAGGLARGVRKDPIVGALFNTVMDAFPDAAEDAVEALVLRTKDSTLSDVFSIVGEFAPSFAFGGLAYSAGRGLAVKGAAKLGANRGISTQLGRLAARQGTSQQQLARFGKEGAETLKTMSVLERSIMTAGGSVGIGGYIGASELVDGAPVSDAVKSALLGAVLTGAFEGGLVALTSAPIIGIRTVKDAAKLNALHDELALPILKSEHGRLVEQGQKLTHEIGEILGVNGQQRELFRASAMQGKSVLVPGEGGLTRSGKQALGPILGAKAKGMELKSVRMLIKANERAQKEPFGGYLRDEPYNPKGVFEALARFRLNVTQTPENMGKQMGRTIKKFTDDAADALKNITLAGDVTGAILHRNREAMGKALGFSAKKTKDGRHFGPIFRAWEEGNEAGARQFMESAGRGRFADDAIRLLDEYDSGLSVPFKQLVAMGGERGMTPKEMLQLGVQKFVPHHLENLPESELIRRMMKAGLSRRAAHRQYDSHFDGGIKSFGSLDFQRSMGGSLASKVERGLPFNTNPYDAASKYLGAVHTRIQMGQRWGLKMERGQTVMDAAVAEGANPALVKSIVNVVLGQKLRDQATSQFARAVTGMETGASLGLAVLPNMSQTINTLTFGGAMNLARGLHEITKNDSRSAVMQSLGLMESMVEGIGRSTHGKTHRLGDKVRGSGFEGLADGMDWFAHTTLKWTGFSQVEKWNRVFAGGTGWHIIRDTMAKNVAGKLRGSTLDAARRRMNSLGIDLDDATKIWTRQGPDSEAFKQIVSDGIFRASTLTQFNPSMLRKPVMWNHPVGKVMAQFKTFALGQGRFLRDQVFAEAKQGNMRPLAYFLSIYPVAGEVVAESKSFARMKERKVSNITGEDDIDRIIQDFTMVGGLGLLSDMWTSARFGKPLEGALGPAVSDAADLVASLAQGKPENILGQVLRKPTAKAITFAASAGAVTGMAFGEFSAEVMGEYLRALEEDSEDPTRSVVDIGVIRTSR